ncbi:unnamed protein product [Pocillopora meandrina]|uniref:Uncharacterized protein n=1 Tax=Pocillopora meandrina TaxID=46732 RepID=A0AAU9W5V1_9CNID|nr:unnamed protein product [Pocillopora meandrina]
MTVPNNMLRGDVTMFLLLKGGGYHSFHIFFLLHRTKKPVTLPSNHVVEHRLVRTDLDNKDVKKVLLEEYVKAHVNPV